MMYTVVNKPKSVTFKSLDSMIIFAMDYLSMESEHTLVIKFNRNLKEHQAGFFDFEEDEGELCLEINRNLDGDELIRTIFHELVHAKQILSGAYDPETSQWYGEEYKCAYKDLPWEKEAYVFEEKMYGEYISGRLE